jgi:Protein of unknown function (DUF2838)
MLAFSANHKPVVIHEPRLSGRRKVASSTFRGRHACVGFLSDDRNPIDWRLRIIEASYLGRATPFAPLGESTVTISPVSFIPISARATLPQPPIMDDAGVGLRTKSEPALVDPLPSAKEAAAPAAPPSLDSANDDSLSVDLGGYMTPSAGSSPNLLARSNSYAATPYWDDGDYFGPIDKITPFDLLSQIQLPSQLEKWQTTLSVHTDRVRKQRERLKKTGLNAKDRMVEEWRRRVATPEEQLDKYRQRMKSSVERLGKQWNDTRSVTLREKVSFIAGVLNIFISGYLIGAFPEYFYLWFTVQFFYFMPIRYYTYHARGYHYFLADLCYFVNALLLLSIWVFPHSKRLMISTYCLAYGNNAVAIAMWRNSLVFHSMDKVTR